MTIQDEEDVNLVQVFVRVQDQGIVLAVEVVVEEAVDQPMIITKVHLNLMHVERAMMLVAQKLHQVRGIIQCLSNRTRSQIIAVAALVIQIEKASH